MFRTLKTQPNSRIPGLVIVWNPTTPKRKNEEKVYVERKMENTLMFCESVNIIASLSIPNPQPPVGGNPYSRAIQNVSSNAIASSSPDCRSCRFQFIQKSRSNSFPIHIYRTFANLTLGFVCDR